MSWKVLIIAGVFEVAWAIGLEYSDGFSKFWPSVATVVALVVSMALLAKSLQTLPVGTAYAVWTGIGAVGTVLCGIALFGDSASAVRLVCVGFILLGILGLKVTA